MDLSCCQKTLFKNLKEANRHKEKNKEDMEGVHDNASAFIGKKNK